MESKVPAKTSWILYHLDWETNLFSILFLNMIEITAYKCVTFFLKKDQNFSEECTHVPF